MKSVSSTVATSGAAMTAVAAFGVVNVANADTLDLSSTLQITEFGDEGVAESGGAFLGLDLDGDGTDDFSYGIGMGKFTEFGSINANKSPFGFASVLVDKSNTSNFVTPLNPGDVVSFDIEGGDASFRSSGTFFRDDDGPLGTVGDSIFIGLTLSSFNVEDPTIFGWAEFTRGSLALNRVAVQTAAGSGAPIPLPIPVPASLALLATGIAGLAAFRRRRRQV